MAPVQDNIIQGDLIPEELKGQFGLHREAPVWVRSVSGFDQIDILTTLP